MNFDNFFRLVKKPFLEAFKEYLISVIKILIATIQKVVFKAKLIADHVEATNKIY